eukprot:Em0001g2954a
MASKPFLLPETFSGESGTKWDEWINHFESCADVNNWTKDEDRLKWVRVRLVGKAQTAFRRLGEDERTDYSKCVGALKCRSDPDSKRTLKVVELQHRKKEKGEDWASFGDALRLLADSAYPELEEKARECLALNQFLSQSDNPQVAFGVKQKRPQTVDEAALAAMELESYLHPNTKTDPALEAINELVERLDRLEGLGIVLVHLTLSKNVVLENKFLVVEGMTVEAILGLDFLETFKCMIDSGDRKISFPNEKLVLPLLDVNQKVTLNPSINCPVVSPQPAARKHFMLDTDASDTGIGAILSQVQDDRVLPISLLKLALFLRAILQLMFMTSSSMIHQLLVLPSVVRESVLQDLHSGSMGGHVGESTRTETVQGPPPENPDENEALLEFAPVGSNIEVLDGIGGSRYLRSYYHMKNLQTMRLPMLINVQKYSTGIPSEHEDHSIDTDLLEEGVV